jgi:hypothetical protein
MVCSPQSCSIAGPRSSYGPLSSRASQGSFSPLKLLPSHVLGIISLVPLPIAIYARYSKKLAGAWNPVYSITGVLALYLNVFVFVVQHFEKVPALHALAPSQSGPPFKMTQLTVPVFFLLITRLSAVRFRHAQLRTV